MSDSIHPGLTPEREALRQRFAVRLITENEEGENLHHLPEGVYGYTTAAGSGELPVFIRPVFQCFEVHKLVGGEVCYIGYLSDNEHQAVQSGLEASAISLYPEPHGDSAKLVSIPLSRIERSRPPSRDQGNWMKLEIGPKYRASGAVN